MVSPTVTSLAADLAATIAQNADQEVRIKALEMWKATHEKSMAARQAQIANLRMENDRLRRLFIQERENR